VGTVGDRRKAARMLFIIDNDKSGYGAQHRGKCTYGQRRRGCWSMSITPLSKLSEPTPPGRNGHCVVIVDNSVPQGATSIRHCSSRQRRYYRVVRGDIGAQPPSASADNAYAAGGSDGLVSTPVLAEPAV
jgi:hypothetical protein